MGYSTISLKLNMNWVPHRLLLIVLLLFTNSLSFTSLPKITLKGDFLPHSSIPDCLHPHWLSLDGSSYHICHPFALTLTVFVSISPLFAQLVVCSYCFGFSSIFNADKKKKKVQCSMMRNAFIILKMYICFL